MAAPRQVAVIGGGWAGLAAAVEATRRGHQVTVFEMAPHWGGRARTVVFPEAALDNGQHILIGAYTQTLALMRTVGVNPQNVLLRTPLRLPYPDGHGLQLAAGPTVLTFTAAVLRYPGWGWGDKLALLRTASRWALQGFRCAPTLSVAALMARLPTRVQAELIDPLCVAALNTPPAQASAQVFLRVLKDALFSGPGSADLLLPTARLSELLADPAARWLQDAGAALRLAHRVHALTPSGAGWQVDGQSFDSVVLACTATEAARLTLPIAPSWSAQASALRYEPIVTVYARQTSGSRLPHPMMALHADAQRPAQFVFDLGALGGPDDGVALVVSGAAEWVARGMPALEAAALAQASQAMSIPFAAVRTTTEKRATFLCTPGLIRPPAQVQPQLWAAGDYVEGPYPATLEGAVMSGLTAGRTA